MDLFSAVVVGLIGIYFLQKDSKPEPRDTKSIFDKYKE